MRASKTLRSRKGLKKQRRTRTRKQKGGLVCSNPMLQAVFKYMNNSCYFDTSLLAILHAAPVKFANALKESAANIRAIYAMTDDNKEKKLLAVKNKILIHLHEMYKALHKGGKAATMQELIRDSTTRREELRDILQKCPVFVKDKMNLKQLYDPAAFITRLFNQDILSGSLLTMNTIYISPDEYQTINETIPSTQVTFTDIQNTFPADTPLSSKLFELTQKSDKKPPQAKANIKGIPYTYYEQLHSVLYGVLPVAFDRDYLADYSVPPPSGGYPQIDYTPINLDQTITQDGITYILQSIVCYVKGHYVSFMRCNEDGSWVYYDDINVNPAGGNPNLRNVGLFEDWFTSNIIDYQEITVRNINPVKQFSLKPEDGLIKSAAETCVYAVYTTEEGVAAAAAADPAGGMGA